MTNNIDVIRESIYKFCSTWNNFKDFCIRNIRSGNNISYTLGYFANKLRYH